MKCKTLFVNRERDKQDARDGCDGRRFDVFGKSNFNSYFSWLHAPRSVALAEFSASGWGRMQSTGEGRALGCQETGSTICGGASPPIPQTGTSAKKKGDGPPQNVNRLNGETVVRSYIFAFAAGTSRECVVDESSSCRPQDRSGLQDDEADQALEQMECYVRLNFFAMAPARPMSPLPNNNAAAGNGTSAGAFTTLPLKTLLLVKGVPVPLSVAAKRSVRAP